MLSNKGRLQTIKSRVVFVVRLYRKIHLLSDAGDNQGIGDQINSGIRGIITEVSYYNN